jgi:hypothetical protein
MTKPQMTKPRMTANRVSALAYLSAHPGASTADMDRACRTARGGHRWMYAVVDRMIRAGLVVRGPARTESARGGAVGLYAVGPNVDSIKAGVILHGSLG